VYHGSSLLGHQLVGKYQRRESGLFRINELGASVNMTLVRPKIKIAVVPVTLPALFFGAPKKIAVPPQKSLCSFIASFQIPCF
jgi:hypothetical protein